MNVLILSCGTGGGHDSAGRAVQEEMERRGHRVMMRNPYALRSIRLSGGIDRTYITAARSAPRAFGSIYKIGDLYRRLPFRSPVYFVNRAMDAFMENYFAENRFDVVLMPHLFPAEIVTNMRKHGMEVPPSIFIATDYVCIPFTEETECDAYVIPAADLTSDFVGRGLPEEKLYALGIPTSGRFISGESRESAKRRLGLDENKTYILVAGGSMGGGKIEQAVARLCRYFADRQEIELIVVCGNNRKMFERLSGWQVKGLRVLGHTDDMASYLRASRLFVTKPGGLSSTEAAVSGVPILHTCAIPGCETHNAGYFSSHGMCISGEVTDEMLRRAERLLRDDRACGEMIDCQRRWINSRAAADICDLAEKLAGERKS